MIPGNHLIQILSKISHQRTADTAGIHLCDLDARILQETAVNADFTELILDQHNLLTLKCLIDHFLDERCLSGSQETGNNINFRHSYRSPYLSYFVS